MATRGRKPQEFSPDEILETLKCLMDGKPAPTSRYFLFTYFKHKRDYIDWQKMPTDGKKGRPRLKAVVNDRGRRYIRQRERLIARRKPEPSSRRTNVEGSSPSPAA